MAKAVVMLRAGAENAGTEEKPRWRGRCERCRRAAWLNWCHVFTRATTGTRWDPDNAYAWCDGCHRWMDQHWESKRDWTINRIGDQRWQQLKLRSQAGRRPDYEAVELFLAQERQALEGAA